MRPNSKIYISGSISGLSRREYMSRFADVEEMLRVRGYRVCNPTRLLPCRWAWVYPLMEVLLGKTLAYRLTLAYDLHHLRKCDGILMMWGHGRSRGARLERLQARKWRIKSITF